MADTPLKSLIMRHDKAAPRYTSYPPATQFSAIFSKDAPARWLAAQQPGQRLSVYVHIPFCARLCYYCGCHTAIANDPRRVGDYLDLLHGEIALAARHVPAGVTLGHLHFGGGSPTMLEAEDFTALMDALRLYFTFAPAPEIAIEADPRQLTPQKIAAYAASGLNRISLGVQDFNAKVLETVNRPQPYELTRDAVHACRAAGIDAINMDLMYGLPYQTLETQRDTFEKAIDLAPSRIAFFGYAHVPWMKKHMSVLDENAMPDASLRYDLCMHGRDMLLDAGYEAVGIDHFARPNDPMAAARRDRALHRNFQGYTTDGADMLLGLGVSAISAAPQGYAQNTTSPLLYADAIGNGQLPVVRGLATTAEDRLRADIIAELMCYFNADIAAIAARHGFAPDTLDSALAQLAPLADDGLLVRAGRRIFIPDNAPQILRIAATAFDAYLPAADAPDRHARAI